MELNSPDVQINIGSLTFVGGDPRHQGELSTVFHTELSAHLASGEIRQDLDASVFRNLSIRPGRPDAMARSAAREIARRMLR